MGPLNLSDITFHVVNQRIVSAAGVPHSPVHQFHDFGVSTCKTERVDDPVFSS